MSTTVSTEVMSFDRFLQILNSRKPVRNEYIGQGPIKGFEIQGQGQFLAKGHTYTVGTEERTNEFNRTIYNLKANNPYEMAKPELKALLKDAMDKDAAGDKEGASELFREYLNKVQMSFSVIENERGTTARYHDKQDVICHFDVVDTKAGEKQIAVTKVTAQEAIAAGKAIKYDVSDLIS